MLVLPHLLPPARAEGCTWARSTPPEPQGWLWWCWPRGPDAASPPPAAGSSGCARLAGGSATPPALRRISEKGNGMEGGVGSNGTEGERRVQTYRRFRMEGSAQINTKIDSFFQGRVCTAILGSRLHLRSIFFCNVKWPDNTLIQ